MSTASPPFSDGAHRQPAEDPHPRASDNAAHTRPIFPDNGASRRLPVSRTLVKRNPALVRPPRNDPRPKRDPDYVRSLADRIQKQGLRNPPYIVKRGDIEEIVVGEHRRQAGMHLGWTEMDFFLIEGELSEADLAVERYQEAEMHTGFSVQERIATYQILTSQGLSRAEIAERLETDESTISREMRIKGNLAPPLQADVESAKLKASCAYILTMLPDHAQQIELAQKLYAGLLKRDSLYTKVRGMLNRREKKAKPVKLSSGGVVATVKGPLIETLTAFIARVSDALKKMQRDGLPPEILQSLLKA